MRKRIDSITRSVKKRVKLADDVRLPHIDEAHRAVRKEFGKQIKEKPAVILHLTKWLLLATLVGALTGAVAAAFLYALDASVTLVDAPRALFVIIPVAFMANVLFVRYVFPKLGQPSTNATIQRIHDKAPISPWNALKAFVAPILTIAGGGSTGKESPAADMGAASGSFIGRILHLDREDTRKLAICGISAGFAAVIGTPIAGAIFGVEVLFVGAVLYEVLLPAFVAGIIGYAVAAALGAPFWYHAVTVAPEFNQYFFLKVILAGIFFGLVSLAFIALVRAGKAIAQGSVQRRLLLALSAGFLIAFFASGVSNDYLGLGLHTVESTIEGAPAAPAAPFWKSIFTFLTLAGGGSGGLLTPVVFVGSTAGSLFATWVGGTIGTFAALGAVALIAGAMNTPIAASVLAIELFGAAIGPYAALASIIAFSITGKLSVYPAQVFTTEKVLPKKSFRARWRAWRERLRKH
jgi:H+/Cl- antiporter ClcA